MQQERTVHEYAVAFLSFPDRLDFICRDNHQDRTHIGLNKNTPAERAIEGRSPLQSRIVSRSRVFTIVTAGRKQREIRAEPL